VSRRLLILRPEPGASATAAKAAAMGMDFILLPLFETRAVEWTAPDPASFDAVLITSANAARLGGHGMDRYLHLPLYAVGEATARGAKASGFTNVTFGTGDAVEIARLMAEDGREHVLHLAGRDRIQMQVASPTTTVVTSYASHVLPSQTIPTGTVALVHSTRAALRFSELAADKSSIAVVAISNAVADAAGPGWQSVTVADQPRDAAMLALAARLCETRKA
jgi:uroporphyrinogen-III synthase